MPLDVGTFSTPENPILRPFDCPWLLLTSVTSAYDCRSRTIWREFHNCVPKGQRWDGCIKKQHALTRLRITCKCKDRSLPVSAKTMLAESVFVLKTKVLCPAAASSGFVQRKISSRLEVGQKVKISKVLRMGLPIMENLSGLEESIFSLFRSPQLHLGKNL